jgi:hypothetical protein
MLPVSGLHSISDRMINESWAFAEMRIRRGSIWYTMICQ